MWVRPMSLQAASPYPAFGKHLCFLLKDSMLRRIDTEQTLATGSWGRGRSPVLSGYARCGAGNVSASSPPLSSARLHKVSPWVPGKALELQGCPFHALHPVIA